MADEIFEDFPLVQGANTVVYIENDNSGTQKAQIIAGGQPVSNDVTIPIGIIMMWSGSIATIPSGFHLCDGTNGTPDLRDSFIVGAGKSYNPGNTGGSMTQQSGDSATVNAVQDTVQTVIGTGINVLDPTTTVTVNQNPFSILPPYYALCYIMRI